MSKQMIVRKHMDFVLAKNIWSGFEGKLIAILIKELPLDRDNDLQKFKKQVIPIKHLEKIMEVKQLHNKHIKQVIEKLIGKAIFINEFNKKDNIKKYTAMTIFSKLSYIDGASEIEFKFNKDMKPYLLNFKKNFVKYHIQNIVQFKNKYSLGIYELCKNNLSFKKEKYLEIELELTKLHEWLQTPKSYQIFDNFRNKVLDPVCSDIIRYSDVAINYQVVKQGRKVVAIKFIYSENLKPDYRWRYWELLTITRTSNYRKLKKLKIEIKEAIQELRLRSVNNGKIPPKSMIQLDEERSNIS